MCRVTACWTEAQLFKRCTVSEPNHAWTSSQSIPAIRILHQGIDLQHSPSSQPVVLHTLENADTRPCTTSDPVLEECTKIKLKMQVSMQQCSACKEGAVGTAHTHLREQHDS